VILILSDLSEIVVTPVQTITVLKTPEVLLDDVGIHLNIPDNSTLSPGLTLSTKSSWRNTITDLGICPVGVRSGIS